MQQGRGACPGRLGLAGHDHRCALRRRLDRGGGHDHATGLRLSQGRSEFPVAQKRNRAPVRCGQGRNGRDDDFAAPDHLPADVLGEGGDRQGRQGLKEPRIGHGPSYDCG
ncbi:hypothetical protein D3C87_1791700 [compost metagenome]